MENPHNDVQQTEPPESGLIACHECDFLHQVQDIPAGAKALCTRCGAELYRHVPNSLNRALALNLSALMLLIIANGFPFLSLSLSGRMEENVLLSSSIAFFRMGMEELGILVFLTSILFPLLTISGMLYVLLAVKLNITLPGMTRIYHMVRALTPWSLVGVFMLGVLVSMVKLLDMATIIPGISLFALAALLVVSTAARSNLDESVIWPHLPAQGGIKSGTTAVAQGMISCHGCGLLVTHTPAGHREHLACPRCDASLHSRKHNSIMRTWALLVSATLLLIPANVYPVMTVIQLGRGEPNTIVSGIIHLVEAGMWPLALLIFFASIVVPVLKITVLSWLLITVQKQSDWRPADRTLLFRVTEVVGAWSMVDVFLVAILTALVNLDSLATVRPDIGVTFFAAVVTITMFAAHSFDPRLIWDNMNKTPA